MSRKFPEISHHQLQGAGLGWPALDSSSHIAASIRHHTPSPSIWYVSVASVRCVGLR